MEEQTERKPSIAKMLAKLEGIKFEPKELVDSWILLTYDIPAGTEGNKARYNFTKNVPKIGGVMHTRSVYLLPHTDKAEIAALNVAKAGQAFIWVSSALESDKKQELTEFYDKEINNRLADISNRIKRIKKHIEDDEERPASRMIKKTTELLDDSVNAVTHRNSQKMLMQIIQLYKDLMEASNGFNK